jgi:hypothetical protein
MASKEEDEGSRLQEESTEREEGIGSISSPIGSLRLCLLSQFVVCCGRG